LYKLPFVPSVISDWNALPNFVTASTSDMPLVTCTIVEAVDENLKDLESDLVQLITVESVA